MAKKGMRLRLIRIPEPSKEDKPWFGADNWKPILKIWDRPYPYADNGFILPEGWFIQVDGRQHIQFLASIGLSTNLSQKMGWISVWDYVSMFNKNGATTEYIRVTYDCKMTKAQRDTIMLWCSARKVTLKRALGWSYDNFKEQDEAMNA